MAGGEVEVVAPASPAERRDRLRRRLAAERVGALLVTFLPNVRYLSGFTGSAGALVVGADGEDVFLTDFRYRDQVAEELDSAIDVRIVSKAPMVAARDAVDEAGVVSVAFERVHVSVDEWETWREAEGPELHGTENWVEALRMAKSPGEITAIERAVAIAEAAFEDLLGLVRPGAVERELAAELDHRLVVGGSERPAFETIVASGPRTALPHARPSERRIEPGEPVLFDFGAVVDGYHSDMTRTVSVGEADEEMARIYAVVHAAQRAALEGLRPGLSSKEADALGRDPIEQAGYGEAFGHSLGHGLGLEVHEGPRLSRKGSDELTAGSVVTVEPGVYIPRLGGVRIEDDVVLETDGARVLTKPAPASLVIL